MNLLPDLMTRGTKELTRAEIQDRLDKNLATLSRRRRQRASPPLPSRPSATNLPAVLDLLRQILREPTLPAKEWGEMQRESLANLEEQLTDPQSLALVRLRRTINPYSKDDVRYIPTPQEEIDEVTALKIDRFPEAVRRLSRRQAGELAMVGDFDPDEIRPLLDKIFDGWKAKQPYERIEKIVFDKVPGGRQQILTPDKANADLYCRRSLCPERLGSRLMLRWCWAISSSAAAALSSRLGDRVRQKEGLSYGVGSGFAADSVDRRASLTLYAIYNPINLTKVETAMAEELTRLLADGVTRRRVGTGQARLFAGPGGRPRQRRPI